MYKHQNGIILQKVDEYDLPLLLELKSESWFGTHQTTIVNMADQQRWFQETCKVSVHFPENLFLIASVENTSPNEHRDRVGMFKLYPVDWVNRKASVGWDVFAQFRGQGYGKKISQAGRDFCFNILNLHRLDGDILCNNTRSIKCAESAGFVKEGVQKSAYYKDGKYVDSFYYGVVRD